MAGFTGMDPSVMRGIAERLRIQADQLGNVVVTVQRSIDQAFSAWNGEDAHTFHVWWSASYRPALESAHRSLVDAAASVERNIREQEHASDGGPSPSRAVGSLPIAGLTPQELAAAKTELERLVRQGILDPTFLTVDVVSAMSKLSQVVDLTAIGSLDDLVGAINHLEASNPLKGAGGPFALLQFGLSAHDLNAALRSSDEPAAWRAGLDMTIGTAAGFVPFGGVAWWGGTKIGEGMYWFGEEVLGLNTPDVGYAYAIENTFGPGVTAEDLTPEQVVTLQERYEGWDGIIAANGDAVVGHWNRFTDAVRWWD